MGGSRFDVWTRRRFGLVSAGFVVALRGLTVGRSAEAKHKKKRKVRCKRLGQVCSAGGKGRCCHTLRCGSLLTLSGRRCCQREGAPCASGDECCLDLPCFREVGNALGICGLL